MKKKFRYLIVGGWNTLFGYVVGVLLYKKYNLDYPIVAIAVVANVVSITMSFVTYKTLVFRTRGRWWKEYLRGFFVYGGSAIIGVMALWLYVEKVHVRIEIAQALAIMTTVIISYYGHERVTFRFSRKKENNGN